MTIVLVACAKQKHPGPLAGKASGQRYQWFMRYFAEVEP